MKLVRLLVKFVGFRKKTWDRPRNKDTVEALIESIKNYWSSEKHKKN